VLVVGRSKCCIQLKQMNKDGLRLYAGQKLNRRFRMMQKIREYEISGSVLCSVKDIYSSRLVIL
jgi:hypothetical protein